MKAKWLEDGELVCFTKAPLYGCRIGFFVGGNDFVARSIKNFRFHAPRGDDGYEAFVGFCRGKMVLVIGRKYLNHGVISHEVRHLTDEVMEHIGHTPGDTANEAAAYLNEWLTNWVYRQLKKHNMEVKCL